MIDQRILDKAIRDLQKAKTTKLTGLSITIDKVRDYINRGESEHWLEGREGINCDYLGRVASDAMFISYILKELEFMRKDTEYAGQFKSLKMFLEDKRDDYWPSMPSPEAIDIVKKALGLQGYRETRR